LLGAPPLTSLDHQFDGTSVLQGPERDAPERTSWFARLSVTAKLNLAVFGNTVVLAVIALVMLAGTFHLADMGHRQAVLASVEVRTNNAAIALVDAVDGLEMAQEGEGDAGYKQARRALDKAYAALSDPIEFAGDRMPEDLGPRVFAFRDEVSAIQAGLGAGRLDEASVADLFQRSKQLYTEVSTFAVGIHERAASSADTMFAGISRFLITFMILTVTGVCLSLVAARGIIRNIAGALRSITEAMNSVAAGDTDVAIPGSERKDEIGAMARALGVFRSATLALRDLTAQRARDAEKQLVKQQEINSEAQAMRAQQSAMLSELAQGFRVSVGEVIALVQTSAKGLRTTSRDMAALAHNSVEQSGEAASAMETASRNVTAAAAATDEFALSITEISRQATASATLAREANDLVGSANTKMSDLNAAAEEIGEIAGLIQTIAQRTNLLALNASIEAARGGEAGRGFAVVASEVKDLANQTSQATSSVSEKIAAMQSSTQASAGDLSLIVEQIAKLEEAAIVIASAVDQQSLSGEELSRNIDTVAEGAQEVSNRLSTLSKASQETGRAAGDVQDGAENLGHHAEALQQKAERFISDIQRASLELAAQGADQLDRRRTAR